MCKKKNENKMKNILNKQTSSQSLGININIMRNLNIKYNVAIDRKNNQVLFTDLFKKKTET
jgi:hypothetical protein